ncbi:TPA: DUF624 domain-containing protein [Streptococcus suis]|nr:DUF624 domain-containing protein [Streptococcus suis]
MRKNSSQFLQSIFDVHHPFWLIVEKCFTIFLLNICFVVTCLPLVTIGMARLALNASLMELQRYGKIPVLSTYFGMVKRHWTVGLKLGLIEGLIVGTCIVDLCITAGVASFPIQLLRVACFAILLFSQMIFPYIYFLASGQIWSLADLVKVSILLASKNIYLTLFILVLMLSVAFVLFINALSFLLIVTVFVVFGFATLAYVFILNCKQ